MSSTHSTHFMNPETQVYINGKIVPSSEAHIAIYDASVVLGATLTDMERTFGHQLFRLDEHLDRFFRSCKYARIGPPISKDQTKKIVKDWVKNNNKKIYIYNDPKRAAKGADVIFSDKDIWLS